MRKAVAVGAGLASILVALAVASLALGGQDRQDLDRLDFTTHKPDKATGVKFRVAFDDGGSSARALDRMVTTFEDGTKYDDSVPRRCKASDAELESQGSDACPSRSIVGDGVVRARAFGMDGVADVTLLNNRDEVILLSKVRDLPGPVRFVDRARVDERRRKLIVQTPDQFDVQAIRLDADRVTDGGGEYLKTPRNCPRSGRWINKLRLEYRDGVVQKEREKSTCDG